MVIKIDRIYTKGGDKGRTSLGDQTRVSKDNRRIIALGAIDELNAHLGLVRAQLQYKLEYKMQDQQLKAIQHDLFDLGADLCVPLTDNETEQSHLRIIPIQIGRLEEQIDALTAQLSPLTSFILPGGSLISAYLHQSRTIARRAEISCVSLHKEQKINPLALAYLNRLSDFLFVLARFFNDLGQKDVLWQKGINR